MATPMTFQDVLNILDTAVNRDDIRPQYMDFINRAVREVAAGHSFEQMGNVAALTIASGASSVPLPADFKDFQPGRFPVYAAIGGAPIRPVPVYQKREISRFQQWFLPDPYLIITSLETGYLLGLLPGSVTAAAWVIQLDYFAFPAVVTDPTQTTDLLTYYPNLILSKTLALIFQSVNDPLWERHDTTFKFLMSEFTGADIQISEPAKSN